VQRCKNKNSIGLPKIPIPANQISISGASFITYKNNINWWSQTFDNKLKLYFENDYLVKDDQIIIVDCVFSNESNKFHLCKENINNNDPWVVFQSSLL